MKIAIAATFILMLVASVSCIHSGDVKATSDAAPAVTPESQIIWVVSVNVIPSKAHLYEAALLDWLNHMRQLKFATPIYVAVLSDSNYQFVSSYPDLAALEKVNAELTGFFQSSKGIALSKRLGEASEGREGFFVMSRPELSYVPENPRLANEEIKFRHREILYIEDGSTTNVAEILKKISSLAAKHKIRNSVWVGEAFTGSNLPNYALVWSGKSASDYYIAREKDTVAMGSEYQELVAELITMLRDYKITNITLRPDLSYIPK